MTTDYRTLQLTVGDGSHSSVQDAQELKTILEAQEPAGFVVVARTNAEQQYIQSAPLSEGRWVVEFQDGSVDAHYGSEVDSLEELQQLMDAWVAGGAAAARSWDGIEWAKVDLD